jgi:hypothetical protein
MEACHCLKADSAAQWLFIIHLVRLPCPLLEAFVAFAVVHCLSVHLVPPVGRSGPLLSG